MEQVVLFVSDGFVGLPEAIQTIFPDSMHQRCWVHIQRNISRKVRVKDREAIASDLKRVYTQPNEELAIKALREMLDKWHKYYPKIAEQLSAISLLSHFILCLIPLDKASTQPISLNSLTSISKGP